MTLKAKLYNQLGEESGEINLPKELFGIKEPSHSLIKETLVLLLGNKRQGTSHTKDRSERRGGGRKPWRQKGTGRARHGSSRSPLWRKGGVTFGPRNEKNYQRKINKKVKQLALRHILSAKNKNNTLFVFDALRFTKTKEVKILFERLGLNSTLLAGLTNEASRATFNLPKSKAVSLSGLKLLDLLKYKYLILEKSSLLNLAKLWTSKL